MNSPEWVKIKGSDEFEVPSVGTSESVQPGIQDDEELIDGSLLLKKKDEFIGIKVFCINCGGKYEQIFLARQKEAERTETFESVDSKGRKRKLSKVIHLYSEFVRCSNCSFASIRRARYDTSKKELIDTGIFIPKRINRKSIENTHKLIHREVFSLYEEAIETYNNGLNFSSGAAIRSIIETICKVVGIREKLVSKEIFRFAGKENIDPKNVPSEKIEEIKRSLRLEDQIRMLIKEYKSEKLSPDKLDVLQEIRDWGNNNIHDNKTPSSDDLNDVLTIIEKLLLVVFVEPHEQDKFSNSISNFRSRR